MQPHRPRPGGGTAPTSPALPGLSSPSCLALHLGQGSACPPHSSDASHKGSNVSPQGQVEEQGKFEGGGWAPVSCLHPEVQEPWPVLILYNREVSWLRFNCENPGSLCVQRTQNIFPFSFCHLNLFWLQKEVPPRTFNCLGKGSLRAPDGVSDSRRGLGGNRPALSS